MDVGSVDRLKARDLHNWLMENEAEAVQWWVSRKRSTYTSTACAVLSGMAAMVISGPGSHVGLSTVAGGCFGWRVRMNSQLVKRNHFLEELHSADPQSLILLFEQLVSSSPALSQVTDIQQWMKEEQNQRIVVGFISANINTNSHS